MKSRSQGPGPKAAVYKVFAGLTWLGLLALMLLAFSQDLTTEQIASVVDSTGLWGFAIFLGAFAFLQPVGLSAHVLILGAAVIWPWWLAIPLSLVGALGSSTTSYFLGHYVAHDWVQAHLPERIQRYETWLVDKGVWGVIVFRLFTFTIPPAQVLVGTTRIPFSTMLAGTAIGFLPQICVDVLLGGSLLVYLMDG